MAELKDEKLDFWIKNNVNVLMTGRHGVGKTAVILQAFERAKLRYKYFSAATLDPWVDLVGVPKEVKNDDGTSYLDLVRPKEFQNDEIDAIFLDEFNRSHKKVRNACMELLQFKSINGKVIKNLRIVWAAVNPDYEEEYNVEKLDPAQADRFQVQIEVPYKPSKMYFMEKYPAWGKSAISWWDGLSENENKKVSPRRLDYALEMYSWNGDMKDVLPESCNVTKLIQTLKVGPISILLEQIFKSKNVAKAIEFFKDENNVTFSLEWINDSKSKNIKGRRDFFVPLLPMERISQWAAKEQTFLNYLMENALVNKTYAGVLSGIVEANVNKSVVTNIKRYARTHPDFKAIIGTVPAISIASMADFGSKPVAPVFAKKGHAQFFDQWLTASRSNINNAKYSNGTQGRVAYLEELSKQIPPNISVEEALETLDGLQKIAQSSQIQTLERNPKYKNFMGLVNHAIGEISKITGKSWNEIQLSYFQKRFAPLYQKIGSSKLLAGKLLCPVGRPKAPKVLPHLGIGLPVQVEVGLPVRKNL